MKRTKIQVEPENYPEEIASYLKDADVYDSSCSKEAKVLFIDKGPGYFLKETLVGPLKSESLMHEYFHGLHLTSRMVTYHPDDQKGYMITERVPGEDCTHSMYLSEPEKLVDTYAAMVAGDEALRDEVDRIERLRDPSHVRDLTLPEMRNLYAANGISLKTQEQTDIPVSLEAWMELTKPDEEIRAKIRSMMRDDMDGSCKTGFDPYIKDDEMYFNQHWILNIGVKN